MKFKTYVKGGNFLTNFSSPGVRLKDYISLVKKPDSGDWAIRKDEADELFQSLPSSALKSGTLPGSTFTSLIGGDLTALSNTAVRLSHTTPQGTFSKVSVNAKGLIYNGSVVSASDIPDLDWGKITSGKPTTAGGYGITDALLVTGGSITGNIKLPTVEPTLGAHAATKGYVDAKLVIFSAPYLKTGDILIRSSTASYTGYLRCNGGILSKTTYASLYAALGETFSYDTNTFKLPDLTSSEPDGLAFFIRT